MFWHTVPKTWNFIFGGVQSGETKNRRLGIFVTSFQDFKFQGKQISPTFPYFLIKNALLYHFLVNLLAHNKKMTEKTVFCKALSPKMASESFPDSCFWSCGFVPHQKWNSHFWYIKTKHKEGKSKIAIKYFLFYLSPQWGHFIKQIKKICHIHFNSYLRNQLHVKRTSNH